MKDAQIVEIALLHIFQPHVWNSRTICQKFNISPLKFNKIQQSDVWRLVEDNHAILQQTKSSEDDSAFQDKHFNKVNDWYEQKYNIARHQTLMSLKIGKLLQRACQALESIHDDFELLENMKDYRAVFSDFSKAYATMSGQSSAGMNDALAIEQLIDHMNKAELEGEQQSLFD